MHTSAPEDPILRFELVVSGNDYNTLVAHLRGQCTPYTSVSGSRRRVRAVIDLDAASRSFCITAVDRHRLPKPLGIRPGSATHQNLANVIACEIQKGAIKDVTNSLLLKQLEDIIYLCPTLTPNTLRADLNDFQLHESSTYTSFRKVSGPVLAILAPTLLLDVDDAPTLLVREPTTSDLQLLTGIVRQALSSSVRPVAVVTGNEIDVSCTIILPPLPADCSIRFFLHWGGYDELVSSWNDELLDTIQGTSQPQKVPLSFRTNVPIHGQYGATFYFQINDSAEKIWLGKPWLHDSKFLIEHDDPCEITNHATQVLSERREAVQLLSQAISSSSSVSEVASAIASQYTHTSMGDSIAVVLRQNQDESKHLSLLAEQIEASGHFGLLHQLKTSYGLGEVVFASPEGSHAGAGGLAQVISGLPLELANAGIPVSIITPLYRHDNGHKHKSADVILESGVSIGSRAVIPQYQATINIHLGPTHYSGTPWSKRPPSTISCKIYLAQAGRVRVFLLAASSIFDRLYERVFSDEQLRRAAAFSRGVLETIATEKLGIRPSIIISNDWMTALIPPFAALAPEYQSVPWLKDCKTVHMIHNGGADYHGRLPLNVNNEDLWPILNLAPEHYFGFKDPFRSDLINLTMAAVQHARGGVVTVSQPYAQQLVSHAAGGDGLEYVLQHKRHSVFGISNGIARDDIDAYLSIRTGYSQQELRSTETLLTAKADLRVEIQKRYGLCVSRDARLLSFVGRIAEQKGLYLLSGFVRNSNHSALEELLIRHPDVQILIAGPVAAGDPTASALCEAVHYLSRQYPGRIASVFNYIAHSTALEITGASTLFLMPSRFEPGGITQLEALAVGTPVVGRCVGGIAATISNFNPDTQEGTGFLCHDYNPTAFLETLNWALSVCQDLSCYQKIVNQAIQAKHSWADRAPTFAAVLQRIVLGEERMQSLSALATQEQLSRSARAI